MLASAFGILNSADTSKTVTRVLGDMRLSAVEIASVDECMRPISGTEEIVSLRRADSLRRVDSRKRACGIHRCADRQQDKRRDSGRRNETASRRVRLRKRAACKRFEGFVVRKYSAAGTAAASKALLRARAGRR